MRKHIFCCSVSAVCLMATSTEAHAQSAAVLVQTSAPAQSRAGATTGGDNGQLSDIVVTARRVKENLQNVPVSVTNITAAEIVSRGALTVEDLALGVPSVSITKATSTKNGANISIRGLVQTDDLITLDPAVGVYIDDIYYARAYAALSDLLDIANVEVLKGPQGTLYGRNTIGGAIKVTTEHANTETGIGGFFRGSYGNYNAVDLAGAVNIPIVKDFLAMRFATSYHKHDGYTHAYIVPINPVTGAATSLTPTSVVDTDDQDSQSYRLSLRATPSSNLTIDVAGSYFRAKDNGSLIAGLNGDIQAYSGDATAASFSTSPQRKADFYSALSSRVPYSNTTLKSVNSTIDWKISKNWESKIIAGYVEAFNESRLDSDGTVNGGPIQFGPSAVSYLNFLVDLVERQHQYTAEFQLIGNMFNSKLKIISGAYYFDEKGSEHAPDTVVYIFDSNSSTNYVGDAHNRSKSIFGNAIYSLTDKLNFNGGLRYTWDTKSLVGSSRDDHASQPGICFYGAGPGVTTSTTNGGPCSFQSTANFSYLTYEAGLDYRITRDIFLYAKTGNGYRSGGQQLRGVSETSLQPFQPDKVVSYEAGIKSELLDRHLRVNLTYYHTKFSNVQTVLSFYGVNALGNPAIGAAVANVGSAKVNGFEAETVVRLVQQFSLSGSLGYSDFKFDNPGSVEALSPKWTYQLSATYVQPTSLGELTARLNYDYKSSFYMNTVDAPDIPQSKVDGYGLLDGRLSLAFTSGVQVSVFGKNLLAKKYYSTGIEQAYNTNVPGAFYGVRGMNIGAPRTYGIELSAKF